MTDDGNDENGEPKKNLERPSDRELKVLKERFGIDASEDQTLEEIGKQFDVTRERIREIEAKALRKLRANKQVNRKDLYCSFCGKSQHEVKKLVSSERGVNICSECVQLCNETLNDDE